MEPERSNTGHSKSSFPCVTVNTMNHEPRNHAVASERKSLNTEHAFVKRETLVGTNDWSK